MSCSVAQKSRAGLLRDNWWLSELTHLEEPWKKARKGLSPNERGNNEITLDSMAEYYTSILPE